MNKAPKLRFKEFSEEWEEKKLEEIGIIGRGKSKHRPRDDKRLFGGKYPFIQTGDIRNAGLFLNNYTQTYSDFGLEQSKLWEAGTLCITIAANIAETSILNINACFPDSIIGVNVFNDKANNIFLKMYFDFKRRDFVKISEGLAQSNLNLDKLKSMFFKIPSIKEQQKIADFLSSVDRKISITEEKLDLFKDYKKGMMQKIFKQEIRFKDENGNNYPDWVEKRLGEISSVQTGNKDLEDKKENGIYPFFVRSKNIERIDTYSYDGEAILIPGDGKIGEVYHYINGKFDYHQRVYKISGFENICCKYIYYYLYEKFKKHALTYTAKATVDSLRLPVIKEFVIKLPCLEEQEKIANFLSSIDNKIENLSNELENLKEFKKGLLQQMFV